MARGPRPAPSRPGSAGQPLLAWGAAVLAVAHVVGPLFFLTNLTRNPYQTQLAFLSFALSLGLVLWAVDTWRTGVMRLPRFAFDAPLALFLILAGLSTLVAWYVHGAQRNGIWNEGVRVWLFTLVNMAAVPYLAAVFTRPFDAGDAPDMRLDVVLAAAWAAAWLGYSSLKSTDPSDLIWDPYGAGLWALAVLYAVVRTRGRSARSFWHVIGAVVIVSGLYAVFQYFGRDAIWSSPIQPYGGRPVSTFGNPNFLSSYMLPMVLVFAAFAREAPVGRRGAYAMVSAVALAAILCTLTRSTYVGLAAGMLAAGILLSRPGDRRPIFWAVAATVVFFVLIAVFPRTPVSGTQKPLARFTEIADAMRTSSSYAPWHQRILIWNSAWDMARERFWLGKGWGQFELFFPFYQGRWLLLPLLAPFRTHANNAHNILLEIWAQTGIIGTGAALLVVAAFLSSAWVLVRSRVEESGRLIAAALAAGVFGVLVDNFFGNVSFFFAVPVFILAWSAASLFQLDPVPFVTERTLSRATLGPVLAVVVGVAFFNVAYNAARWMQEVKYFEGYKMARTNDLPRAAGLLADALEWFPAEVNNNYELGNVYIRQQRSMQEKGLAAEARAFAEKAVASYRAALDANPGYDEIYFNRGVTLLQLGRRDEARADLETAIFINPLLRDAYGALATLYIQSGDVERAQHVFEAALAAHPKDKDYLNNLGYLHSQAGRYDKSVTLYRSAIAADPAFMQAYANLAVDSRKRGQPEPLLAVPDLMNDIRRRVEKGDFAGAKLSASRVLELLPDYADAHLAMGNVEYYAGRSDQALAAYLRALELNPSLTAARLNIAKLHQAAGRLDQARAEWRRVIEMDPKNTEAAAALAAR